VYRPCCLLRIAAGGLFFCCVMTGFFCRLAQAGPVFGFDDSTAPWHIEADTIQSLGDDDYSAVGGVVVTRGEKQVRADVIRFDGRSRNIVATGNVVMTAGPDVLRGDRMEMNLETETGTIYEGELFLGKSHFYIAGDRIEKVGPESYKADKFRITTCDPDHPDWHLSGRDLSFTIEGYGSMRHAALWARKLPVLYAPYLSFPVKTRRQTGFLVPEMDYSDKKGAEYVQPFFWAIDDSTDMTLYAHYMSHRGFRLGAEYRRVFSEQSKIAVMMDGFNDGERGEDLRNDDYGYDGDEWLRTNSGRYWFRMKQDHVFPGGIKARLDLDVVSDQDYLDEFDDGYMGFDETDRFFEDFFGRDIDEEDETVRTNRLNLNKLWSRYSMNADLRWEDDVIKRRWEETDTTVQRLPVVMFNAIRQPVPGLPLDYKLDSEYTFCFRRDGVKGHRTDVYPRIYLPLYWHDVVSIEPSAGVRETAWWMDERDPSAPSMDRNLTRTVYDARLDLSSELYRVFTLDRQTGSKIRHTILPRIVYEYLFSPDEGDRFPEFDDNLDIIKDQNLITYSIENFFTLRTEKDKKNGSVDDPGYQYREICRLKIEQSYDIQEARENNPGDWKNQTSRRPFSPILVELDFSPFKNLRIDMDAGWDKYEHGWSEYDIEASLFDERGDALYVAYRYDRDIAESVYLEANLVVNRFLTLYGEHEHNFFDHLDIETTVGCLYTSDCWSLDVCYTDEPDDDKLSFMIKLHGLSDMATGAAKGGFEMIGAE